MIVVVRTNLTVIILYFQLLVLKYVSNKDVFMKYHKAHLTRRLILGTSADNEKEENMVEWLREVNSNFLFKKKKSIHSSPSVDHITFCLITGRNAC